MAWGWGGSAARWSAEAHARRCCSCQNVGNTFTSVSFPPRMGCVGGKEQTPAATNAAQPAAAPKPAPKPAAGKDMAVRAQRRPAAGCRTRQRGWSRSPGRAPPRHARRRSARRGVRPPRGAADGMATAQTTTRRAPLRVPPSHRQRACGSHRVRLAPASAAPGSQRVCSGANADARALAPRPLRTRRCRSPPAAWPTCCSASPRHVPPAAASPLVDQPRRGAWALDCAR